MMATLVSEAILLNFVKGPRFEEAVDAQFKEFDEDGDGFLSQAELCRSLESLRLFDDLAGHEERLAASLSASAEHEVQKQNQQLQNVLFGLFDRDGDGAVGPSEFAAQMHEIMSAIARGLRGCPLQFLIDPGSVLACAVQQEAEEEEKELEL
ncbi:hypothetical protein GOP47_0004556 [Adiantum capillus-veneris]|uniref:EF-hand domain-containing protein n=1 Tax=Adiantum capillus-veneris TaxID=13818 RepID=A0A9D4V836_ADICA|nr:hypothetical protein GOP47_0004556 [Adiantum capillus-veneris]